MPDFEAMREAMIASQLRPNGVDDPRLLAAFSEVPRESFVPQGRQAVAYADAVVPLDGRRAMNTPMVTARLIDALAIEPGERVLLIGDASGYTAALLARLGADVVATHDLSALAGQFDAVLIDGAVEHLPAELVDGLAPGGRIACGLVDGTTTRLATGRRAGSTVALQSFGDAEIVVLDTFARPRAFSF